MNTENDLMQHNSKEFSTRGAWHMLLLFTTTGAVFFPGGECNCDPDILIRTNKGIGGCHVF